VEGPASFGVQGALIETGIHHSFNITMPRTIMQAVVNGDDANIVTVNCAVTALQPTDGVSPIITMSATTTHDAILGL
jgi:hypothetical protein